MIRKRPGSCSIKSQKQGTLTFAVRSNGIACIMFPNPMLFNVRLKNPILVGKYRAVCSSFIVRISHS